MREIALTQGKVSLVDDEDYVVLSGHKWHAQRANRTFYAKRNVPGQDGEWSRKKKERMHRLVLALKLGRDIAPGMKCDHRDGDGLNNQRFNLREVTNRGNSENLHVAKTSRFVGVCLDKRASKWHAQIRLSGKTIHLGYYATELEAALARERYIEAHPELMARSNFT